MSPVSIEGKINSNGDREKDGRSETLDDDSVLTNSDRDEWENYTNYNNNNNDNNNKYQ